MRRAERSPSPMGMRRRPKLVLTTSVAVLGLSCTLAACSAATSSQGHATTSTSNVLTLAVQEPPVSLDPTKNNNSFDDEWYEELAYDSLIYKTATGVLEPDLALSWGYVGADNKAWQFTLRQGVKFSDGTDLTAQSFVNYMNYVWKDGGAVAKTWIPYFVSATATGPYTVKLSFSAPSPELQEFFSQEWLIGMVIGPKLLAKPTELGTATDGTGPYELDSAQTVANSSYVYVQNPYFWNKSAHRYSKVIIKVIPSATAALAAVQTGQVDFSYGDTSVTTAATREGVKVLAQATGVVPMLIFDREGKLVPAFKSVLVRQALNYAVDRPALAKGLQGQYSEPIDELMPPGVQGYDPNLANYYTYDPAKAKQLLAEAGYPHGFTFTIVAPPTTDTVPEVEALASEFAAVGVTMKIQTVATLGEAEDIWFSGKTPVVVDAYGAAPFAMYIEPLELPTSVLNPFHIDDPYVVSLATKAAESPAAEANKLYMEIQDYNVTQAWQVALFTWDQLFLEGANIQIGGLSTGSSNNFDGAPPDVAYWYPA
jgi:peptide/nickel transport system substrate-binding protein